MAPRAASLNAYIALLRGNRNMRLLWMAQIVSELGDWFYTVAIYSLLLEYTGKASSVALAFVCQVLPQFFIAPAAGVLNDRIRRKRVMIFADWMRAAIVLCMLLVRGPQTVWFLYVLLFLETLMWGLFEPGRTAVIPNITKESEIITANTLSSTTWSFNFAIGAALGGIAAAYLGRDAVFVMNSLSFVVSALLISRMRFAEPHAENRAPLHARELADFTPALEGMRYVRKDRPLLVTLFAKAGLGFMGANWVILPIFGARVFPIHPHGADASQGAMLSMSVLMTFRGIGAILGPVCSGYWAGDNQRRFRHGITLAFVAAGLGYVALGFSPTLALACAAIVLAHAGGSTIWVFSTTLLQLRTEDRFRGRVFAAEFGFSVLTMSASSLLAGFAVDRGAPVQTVAVAVGAGVFVPAIAWTLAQRLWREE